MTALVEIHTHYGVARVEHCKIYGCVSLSARVRLNVCVLRAEQLACALTCDFLNYVNTLAAAVVTLSGITLGILVCKMTSHGSHNRGSYDVFTRDKLQVAALSFKLVLHGVADGRIIFL